MQVKDVIQHNSYQSIFKGYINVWVERVHNSNSDRQLTVAMLMGVTIINYTEQLQRQNGKKAELWQMYTLKTNWKTGFSCK